MKNFVLNSINVGLALLVLASVVLLASIGAGQVQADDNAILVCVGAMFAACSVFLMINKK